METLAEFRKGLPLRDAYMEYEKYLQARFGEAHRLVLNAKDGKEVGDLGLGNSFSTLVKGLDLFQTAASKEMKESLQEWFTEKKSEMLQQDLLQILAEGLPSGALDIVAFAEKINQLKGVQLHDELSKELAAAVPLLFDDLVSKASRLTMQFPCCYQILSASLIWSSDPSLFLLVLIYQISEFIIKAQQTLAASC